MDNDAATINQLLLSRMEELCLFLLPNGKPKGHHWMAGNLAGDPGESLQITMSGGSAGRFIDFANPENKGASPLWLWSKVKNCTYSEAIRQSKAWLGVKDENFGIKRHKDKTYAKPEKGGVQLVHPDSKVMDYLVGERKLDPVVLAKAKVCENMEEDAIAFPYLEKDNETGNWVAVHRKFLKLARPDGKKDCFSTKGTKRCLFGKNLIDDNVSEIVISEGEIDALSWNSWSIPAVSVPNGVSDFDWVDIDWDWLARFERIYVSMDMDEAGKPCAIEICKRLGMHRCFVVQIPKKDANACLQAGLTASAMLDCLKASKALEMDEIKRPDDFKSEVMDYYQTDPSLRGIETPWTPALPWRIRKSEMTILSGFSGHGKTAGLNQLMLHCLSHGLKIMDASLEIKPAMTLYNMTRCALGKKYSDKPEVEACVDWLNESMFFLDCIGTVNVSRIMHAMEYARKRHGIDVFVIDSLFKCGLSGEDYAGARDFADKLTTFCNNTGAHVILVAHSRKTQNGNELNVPSKSDVAGSSDLTNAAFNVIIWWRNKLKKRKLDECKNVGDNSSEAYKQLLLQPDGKIVVDKQRFGEGQESELWVWFDPESMQFHCEPGKKLPYFAYKS